MAQKGALIALGAVGISLGAVYAWKRSKRPAVEAPSSVLVPKKKPSKERRKGSKRHKGRAQPTSGGMHESSEEDSPAAVYDVGAAGPTAEPAAESVADERSSAAVSEQATRATRAMDVESVQPPELEAAAAATRPSAEAAAAAAAVSTVHAESMTGAGVTSSVPSAEPSGETAFDGWIPVERKQRKGRRAAAAAPAGETLTGESQGPEDTKGALGVDELPVAAIAAKPVAAVEVAAEVVAEASGVEAAQTSPEPSPDASEEARRLRREAKKKRKAEQAAAKAESAAASEAHAPAASSKAAPLPRFAPPRPSWADEVDEEPDASAEPAEEAATSADELVAAELDAAERQAERQVDAAVETEAPVEWVEVKKRGGRGKKAQE